MYDVLTPGEYTCLKKLYQITTQLADCIRRRKAAILRISREVRGE